MQAGVPPEQIGVVMVMVMVLNLMTGVPKPSVGTSPYMMSITVKTPVGEVLRGVASLSVPLFTALLPITLFPGLTAWLPHYLMEQCMSRFLGFVRQLGFAVPDIEQAMGHWSEVMGVGPFFCSPQGPIEDHPFDAVSHRPHNSVAPADAGYVQVELIQCCNDVPSCYKKFIDAGHWGLQHTACRTQDHDADLKAMERQGFPVRMSGNVGENGRFTCFDWEAHPGTCIELSEVRGPDVRHDPSGIQGLARTGLCPSVSRSCKDLTR